MSDIKHRINKLKETKSKANKADDAERDQLVVLASRILSEAALLRNEQKNREASFRQHTELLQQAAKSYSVKTVQLVRNEIAAQKTHSQDSFHRLERRFEDLATINRFIGKAFMALVGILLILLALEFFL